MKLEFGLESGKSVKIDFTAMSYNDNRMIKPEIIAAATAFAEAKGIDCQGQQGAQTGKHDRAVREDAPTNRDGENVPVN